MSHCRTLLSTTLVSLFLGLTVLPHLYAQSASPLLFPPWAETTIACPVDMHERSEPPVFDAEYGGVPVGQGASFGPSDGIEVLAATGTENYIPAPDLDIYNPTGARVHFQRCFRSDQAITGYGSPGLAPGWVHNFDLRIVAVDPAKLGGPLQLVYPSGAREPLIPILDATGKPTGTMKAPSGVRSIVTGTPGMAAGVWQQITMTWDGNVTWVFTPSPKGGGTYLLSQMSGLTVTDDDHQRLVAITDTASKKVLMRCVYAASGYLSYINDFSGRKINFAFGTPRGTNLTGTTLLAVSQITDMTAKTVPAAHFYYGYTAAGDKPLLATISVPGDTSTSFNTCTIRYQDGKVASSTDANGNQHTYTYSPGHCRVEVKGGDGKVAGFWTLNFDTLGRSTGQTDAAGHSTKLAY